MSEQMMNHGPSGHGTEFEHEDLSTRGVFVFMIGLAIIGIVIYFIIVGMYSYLDKYEKAQMSTASPLTGPVTEVQRFVPFKPGDDAVSQKFRENGAPMLENDEKGQFKDFLLKQENQLNSYGWVDENAGVAHIPIERAMDLVAERKLPVLPAGGAQAASAPAAKVPAKKAAAKQ